MTRGNKTSAEADVALAFNFFNEISIINQLSSARLERSLPTGLSAPQFYVLNNFVRLGGTRSPAQLADIFQVTRGAMTNTLQRLEASGYVRIRPSPADGRQKVVHITAKGRRAREQGIEAIGADIQQFTQALGVEEIEGILPTLSRARQFLESHRDQLRGAQRGLATQD